MFDIDHILKLGLFNQLIPMWQVFFYIAALVPFLLLNRIKICLLLTYLFTFYLGFMVQWGEYLASSGLLFPFVLYAFSGIIVAICFVVLVFREEGFESRLRWNKHSKRFQRFTIDDKA
jgi:hypothetical protein